MGCIEQAGAKIGNREGGTKTNKEDEEPESRGDGREAEGERSEDDEGDTREANGPLTRGTSECDVLGEGTMNRGEEEVQDDGKKIPEEK